MNLVTRSGTGDWHGDVALYYNADGLTGKDRPVLDLDPLDISRARYTAFPKDRFDRWEPGFSLGGPILKNKLWFFLGYHPSFLTTARTVTFIDESVETREQHARVDDAVANLTGQLGNRLRFRLAYNLRDQTFDSLLPFHEFDDPLLDHDWDSHQTSDAVSAVIDFVATKTFFVSLHGGWSRANASTRRASRAPSSSSSRPTSASKASRRSFSVPPFSPRRTTLRSAEHPRAFQSPARRHVLPGRRRPAPDQGGPPVEPGLSGCTQWVERQHLPDLLGPELRRPAGTFGYYQVFGNDVFPERGDIFQGDVKSDALGPSSRILGPSASGSLSTSGCGPRTRRSPPTPPTRGFPRPPSRSASATRWLPAPASPGT